MNRDVSFSIFDTLFKKRAKLCYKWTTGGNVAFSSD